jgi:hypothetical protein
MTVPGFTKMTKDELVARAITEAAREMTIPEEKTVKATGLTMGGLKLDTDLELFVPGDTLQEKEQGFAVAGLKIEGFKVDPDLGLMALVEALPEKQRTVKLEVPLDADLTKVTLGELIAREMTEATLGEGSEPGQ